MHLFFLQASRVLFSVLFGLIYDAVFDEEMTIWMPIAGILLILALLAPLSSPTPKARGRTFLFVVALLAGVARIPLTINHPNVRLCAAAVILACWGAYTATILRRDPAIALRGLLVGLVADQLFRVLGHSYDVTLQATWWPLPVVLSILLGFASCLAYLRPEPSINAEPTARFGVQTGLALGAFLFLQTSVLSLPNAAARWTGGSYALLAPLLILITAVPATWSSRRGARITLGSVPGLLVGLLLVGGLAVAHRLRGPTAMVAILLAQASAVAGIFCSFGDVRRRGDRPHVGLMACLLVFVLLNVTYAFSFTYPHTFRLFQGAGLLICCLAGLVMAFPALRGIALPTEFYAAVPRSLGLSVLGGSVVAVLIGAVSAPGPPAKMRPVGDFIRLGTYNIHYGYDSVWRFSLEEMAQTIEESEADIIALQEVDTGRPTSYGVDDALWLARRLGMVAIYQPTMEHLTGIALLSRLPVSEWDGRLLTSRDEPTAILRAVVPRDGKSLSAYGIWLGLSPEERATQLDEALAFIQQHDTTTVSFGGDLNARPDSPTYERLARSGFVDPCVTSDCRATPTSPSEHPSERIDYVWVRGMRPTQAQVLESTASDHRMVVVGSTLE